MPHINRRRFLKEAGRLTGSAIIGGTLLDLAWFYPERANAAIQANVYVTRNGTPAQNVAKAIELRFGSIANIIGADDVVVINPNGQWPNQGGSNCACCMALIELILNRPGGFTGEIIFTECTQSRPDGYWTAVDYNLDRNGPYGFNDMILYYQNQGYANVNGVRIWRNIDDPTNWPVVTSPTQGQGWVRLEWTSPEGFLFGLPYPIIRSPYSGKMIDLKNGVWDNGYDGQPDLKFIKVPTLNNHGFNAQQDGAGVTSATKSFMGITEMGGWDSSWGFHWAMHAYEDKGPFVVGESIGAWMDLVRKPDFFMTTAEWVGWGSRWGEDATQARTIGLGDDPVSLDYYMSKYVLWPTHPEQQYFNPDYDIPNNNTRRTLDGCHSLGYGTVVEAEIAAVEYDFNSPAPMRHEIDRMIDRFRRGEVTEQQVLDLINLYSGVQR